MWLTSSSVGRKFIMAITGAVLVLFVTFHCLMNAVAILWPTAYNSVCMFLGANWYALIASAGLAFFIILHIVYACILTVQNRKARGHERYAISHRPANVEWSSQNMLVLGIVILAFLVVHMIQFWAKMQLVEVLGKETLIPATAGTLFLQEAFSQTWTVVVYLIAFIALWFHMTHGFWSMFQSAGWDNTKWIPRLKCIGNVWVTIVCLLFAAEAIVFTVNAKKDFYKTDKDLQAQYMSMIIPEALHDLGPDAVQAVSLMQPEQLRQVAEHVTSIEVAAQAGYNPQVKDEIKAFIPIQNFYNYLDGKAPVDTTALFDKKKQEEFMQQKMKEQQMQQQIMQQMMMQQMQMQQPEAPADNQPAAPAEPGTQEIQPANAPAQPQNN